MDASVSDGNNERLLTRLATILTVLTCLVALVVSVMALRQSARYSVLGATMDRVLRGNKITEERMAEMLALLPSVSADGVCRADIIKPAIGLMLLDVDRKNTTADDAVWHRTLSDAERFLRYALNCQPYDGDIWLRLAMIRSMEGALPEELATLFITSQRLAPVHPDTLPARLRLWPTLDAETQRLTTAQRNKDIAMLCAPTGQWMRKQFPNMCAVNR